MVTDFKSALNYNTLELTTQQFNTLSDLVYRLAGINLKEGKEALVRSRLIKRLRALGIGSFKEYLKYLESAAGNEEIDFMLDVITTNKTSFFREVEHFHYVRQRVVPELTEHRIRFWSAGCSSGEEPYSLAILLRDTLRDLDRRDVKILATDLSMRMLEKAQQAVYEQPALQELTPVLVKKHFVPLNRNDRQVYQVNETVRGLVYYKRLNLMGPWPMRGPFDVIFCRNVMIYFDRATQERLINRFYELLRPGGHLFVGHSESLSSIAHQFNYMQPAVYRK
jgi:chemotaxis protein methyltransferase CheR